jgi:hypothetical protein
MRDRDDEINISLCPDFQIFLIKIAQGIVFPDIQPESGSDCLPPFIHGQSPCVKSQLSRSMSEAAPCQ